MSLKDELKTTPRYVQILAQNGITTMKDFFNYFPRTYEDRSKIAPLDSLIFDAKWVAATKWVITRKSRVFVHWKTIYDTTFQDVHWNTGHISIFNSWFLASKLAENCWYIIVWKPQMKYGKLTFSHPDIIPTVAPEEENEDGDSSYNSGRIFPIYSEMLWIKPWWFAQKVWNNLWKIDQIFSEYLPEEFVKEFQLLDVKRTIKNLHYPDSEELKNKALYRLFFDRLLRIQIFSLQNKLNYQWTIDDLPVNESPHREILKPITDLLPFQLTVAQKKVIIQILEDFHRNSPMLRLLQWDVGSWKTIVATIAMWYIWKQFHGQSVLLAPLEVLANQHFKTLAKFLLPLWLRVELLTGSLTKWEKTKIKSDLKEWKIDVLVTTHAVLQDDVDFKNLMFVCIDEQHKFGVKQRAVFKKFNSPHILQMTATPIPRSMALAFFGEFDVSIIDQLPEWRQKIDTKVISANEWLKLKPRILQKIGQWQRVFIVTPLIEDSEKMEEVQSAVTAHAEICGLFEELPNDEIALLHWRLSSKEKDAVMWRFKEWKAKILVSTTVIEVGVDIPEATVMVIKNAERFWLSQLHQLRWRIWRSELKSYCFLETEKKSWDSYKRLKIMEEVSDWFKLAEYDFKNRGSGEILGTMQSWQSDIPIEILSDLKFLEKVQEWARWILKHYPDLNELPALQNFLNEKIGDILA